MAFPDRIERTVDIPRPPSAVWTALTTAEGLGTWFGNSATIDRRVGGTAELRWEGTEDQKGDTAELRIERLEEPTVFAYTWRIHGLPEDDPRRTYVEFTLAPTEAGTRLTVVESGFGQLSAPEHTSAYGGNTDGWKLELGELVDYLTAA